MNRTIKLMAIALVLLLAWAFLCINWACNTTKKNYSLNKQIEKKDSTYKVDSVGKSTESTVKDSAGKKTWDSETTVEFDNGVILLTKPNWMGSTRNHTIISDSLFDAINFPTPEDAYIELKGVKKITRRTSGTDTASKKEVSNKAASSDLKKKGSASSEKKVIQKEKQKESKRFPIGLVIGIAVVLIVGFFLFLIYKRSKEIEW